MSKPRTRSAKTLIALHNCTIILDGKAVLDDVSFALCTGERWALIGPNGSGKTIFLKLLRGDMWPTPLGIERREYCIDDESSDTPYGAKEHIAYVGPERQDKYVRYGFNHSVERVVATGLFDEDIPRSTPSAEQRRRVARLLKRFSLWSLRRRGFLELSYGQRRRTLIARAFAAAPRVLLLDEVFNGLDAFSTRVLRTALRGRGARTWIMTTHRPQDIPANTNRFIRIMGGRLSRSLPSPPPSPGTGRGGREDGFPEILRRGKKLQLSVSQRLARRVGRRDEIGCRTPLIDLRNVDLYREYRLVLRDVNWTLRRGEHWAVFGANGSGKSSLLKLLYGDLHPKLGGVVERDGVAIGTPIALWKRRVGFVSPELQADYFLARDLEEVVMSGRHASVGLVRAPTRADRQAARRWLTFFGLDDVAHRGPRAVSYGQMRRALLARAMINDPELLLLDEPCAGLDVETRTTLMDLLDRIAQRGTQLIVATHERAEAPKWVTNELVIERGGVCVIRSGATTARR